MRVYGTSKLVKPSSTQPRDDVLPVCELEQVLFNLIKETAHDSQLDVT
jgi:hypothetical protein